MLDSMLRRSELPRQFGPLADLAAVPDGARSRWVLLFEDGVLVRWDADTGEHDRAGQIRLPPEPTSEHPSGNGPMLRLHGSRCGGFAAVCRDYGRYGAVVDLRTGQTTLALDGGDYHADTVPLSFAFTELDGRTIAIHRTAWNRLDLSDPATGRLISAREFAPAREGEEPPAHALDYFHGELYVSPDGRHVLDDGWVWHPVGIPMVWDLDRWLMDNPWESEDGPSKVDLCVRAYCWGRGMAWLDDRLVALEGLGDDDQRLAPGARIFDIEAQAPPETAAEMPGSRTAQELFSFPGPSGGFFGGRGGLFSADSKDLSVWDPKTGDRVALIPGFSPTHQHVGANELACITDGMLIRWTMGSLR